MKHLLNLTMDINSLKSPFKTSGRQGKQLIFDIIRKKYVPLTPEEWVRQNFIHYLVHQKEYPGNLLAVEITLRINGMNKRADIVAYNSKGEPVLIVECKSPRVKINQQEFDQAAMYNLKLNLGYMVLTNGLDHYCCRINYPDRKYEFLHEIPSYPEIRGRD